MVKKIISQRPVTYAEALEILRKRLKEELKLSDEICIMLVNILPQTPEEVRTILASENVTLTSEEINKILEILSECIKSLEE